MRLLIDLQGAQGENRGRGIGRYSLSLTEALIRNAGGVEIMVLLNARLGAQDNQLLENLRGLLPAAQIKSWLPPPHVAHLKGQPWLRRGAEILRENVIARFQPDIVHISSLFEGLVQDGVTSIGRRTAGHDISVTLYDLIPMLHPEIYLEPNPTYQSWYLGKLDHLRRASLCLAISDSSRREAITALGLAEDQVVAISAAIDAQFAPSEISAEQSMILRRRYGLIRPFLLYTGGIDPRKNIEGLIRAFAALPPELRDRHQLAIVCSVSEPDRARLTNLAQSLGLTPGSLIMSGFVPEEDLIALYQLCELFVFPSWHEGFGLPALEAMACGAPVIAGDNSSLPEVIERADMMFDARDDHAITAKMHHALTDADFRLDIRRFGLQQAKKFSWDSSAKRALDAYADLAVRQKDRQSLSLAMTQGRPRLAYVSPLPPARSGIADYSRELLPELSRHYEIEVVTHQSDVTDPWIIANCAIRDAAWFDQNAERYDRILYHFGNSEFHLHMFALLARHPGVVMLHDFYLSGAIAHGEWHHGDLHGWSRALYDSHGYQAVAARFASETIVDILFHYPCCLPVLQQASGVIVHSDYARRLTQQWFGATLSRDLTVIPHLRLPASQIDRKDARQALGLAEDEFIVCSFGLLGPLKLNHRLLDSWLESGLAADRKCRLIFVGENQPGEYGEALSAKIKTAEAPHRITITGFASVALYQQYLAACDLAVQLRSQSRGETSGTVLDCMNYGIATLVNDHGSMADLPKAELYHLADDFSDAELAAALNLLRHDASLRAALGDAARAHILRHHEPRRIAFEYHRAIEDFYARPRGIDELIDAMAGSDAPPADDLAWMDLSQSMALSLPPPRPLRQLFVDISELVRFDAQSGIQRVVRKILSELLAAPPPGYRVEPVYASLEHGYRYARHFTLSLLNCPTDILDDEMIQYQEGDHFLGLDLQPHIVPHHRAFFAAMRAMGVRVSFTVYDLLCIERPDCFFPGADVNFAGWLETVCDNDGAICISSAVADSLKTWLLAHRPERQDHFAITHFHLGADFSDSEDEPDLPEEWLNRPSGPSLLMVGSIEPRKGYAASLAAAEALWREGENFTLTIVGKIGWMTEHLVASLSHHPERNRRLFWFEKSDDATLAALYRQSDGLLFASEGEGFGLPLVEAAHYGLPILVRDLPVFREVAGAHARYFSGELTPSLREWLAELRCGSAVASQSVTVLSWKDSADQLTQRLLTGPEEPPPAAREAPDAAPSRSPLVSVEDQLQFYPGYRDEDVALLKRYATLPARIYSDHFSDGFGNKTLLSNVLFCNSFRASRLQLPVPDDGYHAETIEYVALVDSVDRAAPDHYCIVEIGAAWGPWVSLGGSLARRTGRDSITLVAVEADPPRFQQVARQLTLNQLRPEDPLPGRAVPDQWTRQGSVHCRLIQGAAGADAGILWFPKLNITDLGAAAAAERDDHDYRGAEVAMQKVTAFTLDQILDGIEHVDLLHVDIQGSEYDLLSANLALLARKVDAMLIGTHSRVIEGNLIALLIDAGWHLEREKPCRVDWSRPTPDLTGRTVTDGCQYWRKRRN